MLLLLVMKLLISYYCFPLAAGEHLHTSVTTFSSKCKQNYSEMMRPMRILAIDFVALNPLIEQQRVASTL